MNKKSRTMIIVGAIIVGVIFLLNVWRTYRFFENDLINK